MRNGGRNGRDRLLRSNDDRWIAGVCSGIAEYFGWDVNVTRLIYLLLTCFTAFAGILVYIILWVLMPSR